MSFLVELPIYNRKGLKLFFCFYMIFSSLLKQLAGLTAIAWSGIKNRLATRMTNRERGVVVKKIIFYNSHHR